ncbi:MAG: Gfo/Idh/MocA family oxidoreductase [Oscillospiraceae bacterium]|nr:Gfo/Idh/MocA family oxidoreductase [Oscillospiraceae bacterium]
MEKVRIGVIGYGNMGSGHAGYLSKNEIKDAEITALCDNNPEKLEKAQADLGGNAPNIQYFDDYKKLLDSKVADLIIIAAPHYFHPVIGMDALKQGINVLSEKPIGVYTKNVEEMNELAKKSGLTYGIMFQQRTHPVHKKIKQMMDDKVLGDLKRIVWIVTNWYRSQSYYNSGGWRATWSGEGGGVLINQCPHNLDLWQWFFGLPERIRGFCAFGKYRDIEVEDDVTAYMEYKNGATGVLMTTTGETPGTNRLEVSGDNGKLIFEDGKITLYKNEMPETEFNKTYTGGFGQPKCEKIVYENGKITLYKNDMPESEFNKAYASGLGEPECEKIEIEIEREEGWDDHRKITQNVVNHILYKEPLIADGYEGIKSLTISNSIYLSTWLDSWVNLPIDKDLYLEELKKRIATSKSKENYVEKIIDLAGSSNV